MSRHYQDNRWIDFRESIFEMDGFSCVKCSRSSPSVVLQVHHKQYRKGKAPWDYPAEDCETLCKGCHAREHGEIRPNEGWSLYSQDDLGGLDGECECCGTSIRYVFHIDHEHWEPMAVGTVCCDNLTGTTEATAYRKLLDRKKRFLSSSRWYKSSLGECIKYGKALEIEIQEDSGEFKIYMNGISGKKRFSSCFSAKEFAFELIQNGTAKEFAKRHPLNKG